MRTKTLLAAAILAAGLATSMAQTNVYSLNVVGYYNVTLPAVGTGNGFVIAGNQLTNAAGNDIAVVIPRASVPANTTVYSWNGLTYDIVNATTDDDDNAVWSGAMDLSPGKGFWVKNNQASPLTITFVGEVLQGTQSTPIPAGMSMKSSKIPQSGDLATVLGYPAVAGSTVVYFWRGANYVIPTRTTDDDDNVVWSQPCAPEVGEGFWVSENASTTWARTFTVPQN